MKDRQTIEAIMQRVRHCADKEMRQRMYRSLCDHLPQPDLETGNAQSSIRRAIMKSKKIRYSAAAILILGMAAGLFAFMGPGAEPGYAVEHTLDALQKVRTIHAHGDTWDGKPMEAWIKVDRKTGREEFMRVDIPENKWTGISTPLKTVFIDHRQKMARIKGKMVLTLLISFKNFFTTLLAQSNDVTIKEEYNESLKQKVVRINGTYHAIKYKVLVDPKTKLPLQAEFFTGKETGIMCRTIDTIAFNEDLPDALFQVDIPEGYKTVDQRKEPYYLRPEFGMPINDLEKPEAAQKIARAYLQAAIKEDWKTVNHLRPIQEGPTFWQDKHKLKNSKLLKVSEPYTHPKCWSGQRLIVPCKFQKPDKTEKTTKIIVHIRPDKKAVITGIWQGD